MNKIQLKYYQEKAQAKGKQLLVEECNSIITSENVEFLKEGRLIESAGKQYEALAIVKNCPVSKFTRNKNNRVYNESLWKYVKKQGMHEGTYSLADHPVEEGSVKDTWGIWHGLNLTENGAFSDLYLIEEKPVRILKAGGSLGTSTVGYGEFMEDGETVNPESYELERLGDIVLNPSQGTFATFENIQENTQKNEKNNLFFESEITNNKLEILKENKQTNEDNKSEDFNKMTKDAILNVKNHVRIALKEARENSNYKEAIQTLEEMKIDIPEELNDQKVKIENEIMAIQEKMENEIKNASKLLQEKEVSFSELKSKYDTLNASLNEMTDRYKKAEAIINKAGLQEDENKVCYRKADAEIMESNLKVMKEDINKMEEDRKLMESDISLFEEDMAAMSDDISKFKEERTAMLKDIKIYENKLKKAEAHIVKLEKVLKEDYDYDFEDDDEEEIVYADELDGDEVIVDGEVYEPMCEEEFGQDITSGDVAHSSTVNDTVSVEDGSNKENNFADNDKTKVKEAEADYDEDKKSETNVETPKETQVAATYKEEDETDDVEEYRMNYTLDEEEKEDKDEDDDSEEEDEEDMKDEKKDDDKKEKKEESYKFKYPTRNNGKKVKKIKESKKSDKIVTTHEVMDFYTKAVKEKPFLKDFKKEILNSKSLMEAVDKVGSIKKKSNDMIKIKEDVSKKEDGVTEYKFKSNW